MTIFDNEADDIHVSGVRTGDERPTQGRYQVLSVRLVALLFVPEHHVRQNGDLARVVLLASVEEDWVDYSTRRSS